MAEMDDELRAPEEYQREQRERRILELMRELKELEAERDEDLEAFKNSYEELLIEEGELVNNMMKDSMRLKLEEIKSTPCADIPEILAFFEGQSQSGKRKALMNFLKDYPAYKSTDPKLLRYRLMNLKRKGSEVIRTGGPKYEYYQKIARYGFIF